MPKKDRLYGSNFGGAFEFSWDIIRIPFLPGTLMFRKSIAERIGGFNKRFNYSADTDFIFRLAENTKLFFLNEDLILYRLHKKSASHNKNMPEEELLVRRAAIHRRYKTKANF